MKSILEIRNRVDDLVKLFMSNANGEPDNEACKIYGRAMSDLYIKINHYFIKDNGLYPPMTPEAVKEIIQDFNNAIQLGKDFVSDYVSISPNVRGGRIDIVKSINLLLSKDIGVLNNIHPSLMTTFPETLAESKRIEVDLTGQEINTSGANMSVRIPMKVEGLSGNIINGFFTEESKVKSMEEATEPIRKELKEKFPNYADKIVELFNDPFCRAEAAVDIAGPMDEAFSVERKEAFKNFLYMLVPGEEHALSQNEEFFNAFRFYAHSAQKVALPVDINTSVLMLSPGDNIDTRNVGMSIVSNMLGRPDLICQATPMTIKIGDKTIKGTIMENAKGKDITKAERNDEFSKLTPESFNSTGIKKSLADLQIIDLVCGNIDRHLANLFYQFDENGKLTGFHGIDNDASFPCKEMSSSMRLGNVAPTLNALMVISESMAEKIMNLDKNMLKQALKDTELTDEAIDFAYQRVERIKESIVEGKEFYKDKDFTVMESGYLRTVKDEDWDKINFMTLAFGKNAQNKLDNNQPVSLQDARTNYFGPMYFAKNTALGVVETREEEAAKEQEKKAQHAPQQEAPEAPKHQVLEEKQPHAPQQQAPQQKVIPQGLGRAIKADTDQLYTNFAAEKDIDRMQLQNLVNLIKKNDPLYIRSSKEFKNMRASLEEYNKLARDFADNPNKDKMKKMYASAEKLMNWAELYIVKKSKEEFLTKRGNERLNAAFSVYTAMTEKREKLAGILGKDITKEGEIKSFTNACNIKLKRELAKSKPDPVAVQAVLAGVMVAQKALNNPKASRFNKVAANMEMEKLMDEKSVINKAEQIIADAKSKNDPKKSADKKQDNPVNLFSK